MKVSVVLLVLTFTFWNSANSYQIFGPESLNETLTYFGKNVKPFISKIPCIIETCLPIPSADLKLVKECLSEMQTEIPCVVDSFLEKKSFEPCIDELLSDYSKMVETINFLADVLENCPSKCIFEKFGLLNGWKLDVNKTADKLSKYSFVSNNNLTADAIKEWIDNFMPWCMFVNKHRPIEFFGIKQD